MTPTTLTPTTLTTLETDMSNDITISYPYMADGHSPARGHWTGPMSEALAAGVATIDADSTEDVTVTDTHVIHYDYPTGTWYRSTVQAVAVLGAGVLATGSATRVWSLWCANYSGEELEIDATPLREAIAASLIQWGHVSGHEQYVHSEPVNDSIPFGVSGSFGSAGTVVWEVVCEYGYPEGDAHDTAAAAVAALEAMLGTLAIDSHHLEDYDDCLTAAADMAVERVPWLASWDVEPRWADAERSAVLISVPVEAAAAVLSGPFRLDA